ncbi:MAG: type II toxin-antitoxin system HicA family toxin [Planctomycetes bacterium]|nr:type II toxin-antitoxin system HicA family toxin [Planctomycetota bacterium]
MKRRDLIAHMRAHGCNLAREGGRHTWWFNPATARYSAVPRHTEVSKILAKKICSDLGIQAP